METGKNTVATYIYMQQTHSGLLGDHPNYNRTINPDKSYNEGKPEADKVMETGATPAFKKVEQKVRDMGEGNKVKIGGSNYKQRKWG